MYSIAGNVITQANSPSTVYDSGTTYSAGDVVSFDGLFYKFDPFVPVVGARMTFTANETLTNRNAQLDFSQVIQGTNTNLAFNTTNGIGVDSPNAVSFGGRRFYRTNGSNALTVKVTQWTSLINTDGILDATADISGTDPFIDLYNADGSNMTLPTVTGTVRFGSSVAATQTSATTSGDPSTDTDNWDLTNVIDTDLSNLPQRKVCTQTISGTANADGSVQLSITSDGLVINVITIQVLEDATASTVASAFVSYLLNTDAIDTCTNTGGLLNLTYGFGYKDPVLSFSTANGMSIGTEVVTTEGHGVTTDFDGTVIVYTMSDGVNLKVDGTQEIDPEVNRLVGNSNLVTQITGTLVLGREVTENGFTRFTQGIAIASSRAQSHWFGGVFNTDRNPITVTGSGKLAIRGASTMFPGVIGITSASASVWYQKYTHFPRQYNIGVTDPTTGLPTTTTTGINTGTTNARGTAQASRGYIGWVVSTNVLYEDYTLIGGGEISYGQTPSGNNTVYNDLTGLTKANGLSGFKAQQANTAILAERTNPTSQISFINTAIANQGNLKDVAINSNLSDTFANLSRAFMTNEAQGSDLSFVLDVTGTVNTNRNWGYITLSRNVNFDIKDGLTGNSLSGGITFMRDHNNRDRKTLNTFTNLPDKTYQSTLTSGSVSTDFEVLEKVFNTPFPNSNSSTSGRGRPNTTDNPEGVDRSSDVTRTSATELTLGGDAIIVNDRIVFVVVPTGGNYKDDAVFTAFRSNAAGKTSYAVNTLGTDSIFCYQVLADHTVDGVVYSNLDSIADLRSNTNALGADGYSFVFWHPEYNPGLFLDTPLNDGTTGTLELIGNILPDSNYSDTSSTETEANNPDELYDFIKQTKCQAVQTTNSENGTIPTRVQNNGGTSISENKFPVEYPTIDTLAVSKSGDYLNIGARAFSISTATTGQYTITNSSLQPHSGSTDFGGGSVYKGVETSLDINLTNIDLATLALKGNNLLNFPTTIPATADLDGIATFTSSSDVAYTIPTSAKTSELALINTGSGSVTIPFNALINFKSVTGDITFPSPRTIVVTAETTNTVGRMYVTYGGSSITVPTAVVANGVTTWTFVQNTSGAFIMGGFMDGFNFTSVDLGTDTDSGTFSLVPRDAAFINYSVTLGSLAAKMLSNRSASVAGGILTLKIDPSTLGISTATKVARAEAILLSQRWMEDDVVIAFLLGESNGATFFRYASLGWLIADTDKFKVEWSADELLDVQINVFPTNDSEDELWEDITSSTPARSIHFPSEAPLVIEQTTSSTAAFIDGTDAVVEAQLDSRVFTSIK